MCLLSQKFVVFSEQNLLDSHAGLNSGFCPKQVADEKNHKSGGMKSRLP